MAQQRQGQHGHLRPGQEHLDRVGVGSVCCIGRPGSVNAAAAELGTTWPSLRKAFTRHGLGMPARNPKAVRQRAIEAARQRTGRPATPSLDPVFVALNPGTLPARERPAVELYE